MDLRDYCHIERLFNIKTSPMKLLNLYINVNIGKTSSAASKRLTTNRNNKISQISLYWVGISCSNLE